MSAGAAPAAHPAHRGSIELEPARILAHEDAGAGQHVLRLHAPLTAARAGRGRATASSTAMRTATPLRTWSRITLCGPSATSLAISMPRFIGCGCMTIASGLAIARRRASRP